MAGFIIIDDDDNDAIEEGGATVNARCSSSSRSDVARICGPPNGLVDAIGSIEFCGAIAVAIVIGGIFCVTFVFVLILLLRSGRRDARLSIKLLSIAAKFVCRSVAVVVVAKFCSTFNTSFG